MSWLQVRTRPADFITGVSLFHASAAGRQGGSPAGRFTLPPFSIEYLQQFIEIPPKEGQLNRIQIVGLVVGGFLALVIFQLIRKKKLKEQYSLLWFATVAVILALAVWEGLLGHISSAIGIEVPSNALFLLGIIFLFGMALHFSMLVSRLTDQSKMLAQRLALLDRDLRKEREARLELEDAGKESGAEGPTAGAGTAGRGGGTDDGS